MIKRRILEVKTYGRNTQYWIQREMIGLCWISSFDYPFYSLEEAIEKLSALSKQKKTEKKVVWEN